MNLPENLPLIWVTAGIVLILLEFLIPGLIIVFFGLGALVTGLALYAGVPSEGAMPFVLFGSSTLILLFVLRNRFKETFQGKASNPNEELDDEFVGHSVTVINWNTATNSGRISFRGTVWDARSTEPIETGGYAVIEKRDGATLTVKPN